MKTKLLAAATAALGMLFSVNAASAATYTVDVDYNLLDGTICNNGNCGASSVFGSQYIPVNLPTLYAGDVIDTTINFTRGLALTINDPGPDRQEFGVLFFPNNSAGGFVYTFSQLSLLHAHGDLLIPPVFGPGSGYDNCRTCVGGIVAGNFTDGSFSFRGMDIVTTILSIDEPFGSDSMSFFVAAGLSGVGATIEITHGASGNPVDPVPLPAALPLFATGLVGLGLLGWRRKKAATIA